MSEDLKKMGDAERVASEVVTNAAQSSTAAPGVAPTGTQQAFRNITRQLTEDDLANPGVQKLILAELDQAKSDLEVLSGYESRFHETDKRAAVLEEKVKTYTMVSVTFDVCIGVGGVLIGLSPALWADKPYGLLVASIGTLLCLVPILCRKLLK